MSGFSAGSNLVRAIFVRTVMCAVIVVSLIVGPSTAFSLNVGDITTVAGTGTHGYSGDGGQATSAMINGTYIGVAADGVGNLYIADYGNSRVRKVDANGIITTVAGAAPGGFGGDGGPATAAKLTWPIGVAIDNSGNIYIADTGNHNLRKVDTNGIITTVAGAAPGGFGGDGGLATAALLYHPSGVSLDSSGNLYIGDLYNHRIRKVDTNGIISTIAGNGTVGYSGEGGLATAAGLYHPLNAVKDNAGNLYIAGYFDHRIHKVDTNGIITTVAGTGTAGYSGDGGPATSAMLNQPFRVAVDCSGNLFIADYLNSRVRKVDTNGIITTVAGTGSDGYSGDGGPATAAMIGNPTDVAIDNVGNLIFADCYHATIRKVIGIAAVCGCSTSTYHINASVNGGNGSITTASSTINGGNNAVVSIAPASGYHLATLTDNGNVVSGASEPNYVIMNVSADHNIVATFAANSYTIEASVSGGNGTITPANAQVSNGGSATITINQTTPGYRLATLTDNGINVTANVTNGSYTIGNVTANHTVVATFVPGSHSVTSSVTAGSGSITPTSLHPPQSADVPLIITPFFGNKLATITDNGIDVAASVTNNIYTISNITSDHSVTATFVAIDTTPPVLNVSTMSAGANNVLNISGAVTDNIGVKELIINGVSVPVNADTSFSHALTLANGLNTFFIVATDLAGNRTTAEPSPWIKSH